MPINSPCRFDQQHNMTGSKKEFSIVALTLLALGALACALAWPGYSQGVAQTSKSQTAIAAPDSSLVKKTIQPLAAMTSEPVWAASARQNSLLRDQLTWVFGGREQRGWALYTPLIARTLDTNAPADTSDFAQALARWQRGASLQPTGTLDSDTLYQLIGAWQAPRLKGYTYPTPDQLMTAP